MAGLSAEEFERIWQEFEVEAEAQRFPMGAVLRLAHFYRQLDDSDRVLVEGVLSQWADADDSNKRFDATALIRQFKIKSAVPYLHKRLARLSSETTPHARYESTKIEKLVDILAQPEL